METPIQTRIFKNNPFEYLDSYYEKDCLLMTAHRFNIYKLKIELFNGPVGVDFLIEDIGSAERIMVYCKMNFAKEISSISSFCENGIDLEMSSYLINHLINNYISIHYKFNLSK